MNRNLQGLTAVATLVTLTAFIAAPQATYAGGSISSNPTGRQFSILPLAERMEIPASLQAKPAWHFSARPELARTLALAQQTQNQSPPPELGQIATKESEYGRRKAAAVSKIGMGTVAGTISVVAALGLAALGYEKNKEEEERGVPDNERSGGYYFAGGLLVGVGGGSWGFSLRRKGKLELEVLRDRQIGITINGKGNPMVAYRARF